MDQFVKGLCKQKCPEREIILRSEEKLVHFYEKNPTSGQLDRRRMVKAFARSAAGKECKAQDLRTLNALKETVNYLLSEIFPDRRKPYHFVYDFIFDRFRAIRQEIVMQNLNPRDTVSLLEPMIIFFLTSRHFLSGESLEKFDRKICRQHTMECVQTVLVCYETETVGETPNRNIMESIYLLMNLGNADTLQRGLSISGQFNSSDLFRKALKISLYCWQNNYYQVLRMWTELPTICCMAAATESIPDVREKLMARLVAGFHNKHLTVPLSWLEKIFHYGDRDHLLSDLRRFCIENVNETDARFDKVAFNKREKTLLHRPEPIVERKLSMQPITTLLII
ncbi:SAC3 domain-containing protein 1 [Sergentomyia squamirostris]